MDHTDSVNTCIFGCKYFILMITKALTFQVNDPAKGVYSTNQSCDVTDALITRKAERQLQHLTCNDLAGLKSLEGSTLRPNQAQRQPPSISPRLIISSRLQSSSPKSQPDSLLASRTTPQSVQTATYLEAEPSIAK